jgi:hypothetical protein
MSDENLSKSTKAAVALARPQDVAGEARSHGVAAFLFGEGHDSGAEKVSKEITRLSEWTGDPRGGGKC